MKREYSVYEEGAGTSVCEVGVHWRGSRVFHPRALAGVWLMVVLMGAWVGWTHSGWWGAAGMATGWALSRGGKQVQRESVLMAKDFGVQIEKVGWDGRRRTAFFDRDRIRAFVLGEHVGAYRVEPYAGFVIRGEEEVRVVFEGVGLASLRRVYGFVNRSLNLGSY